MLQPVYSKQISGVTLRTDLSRQSNTSDKTDHSDPPENIHI